MGRENEGYGVRLSGRSIQSGGNEREGWWAEGAGFSRMAAVGVEGTRDSNEAAIRRPRGRRATTRSGIMQSRF